MTAALGPDHFDAFVHEVHQREPFPWQRRLIRRVVECGWPPAIDVPTGLGKTSVIDAFVFAAALRPDVAPRRLFFVVDRRIVVDEAYEHASAVAEKLMTAPGGTVRAVADRLRLPGDDRPLDVARMRGGVTWGWRWLDRPDRRAVVVGTVDQIGSRLLFRGYGVGERLRPIDAALVGCDSVVVVDEAHLSEPFVRTVAQVRALDRGRLGRPPAVVTMSATISGTPDDVLGIDEDDRADPEAGRRLAAAKRLYCVEVATTASKADAVVGAALAEWAVRIATDSPAQVVGVVANTVARARTVFELLRGRAAEAVLLTGRVRPVDRDALLERWYPRVKVGRTRTVGTPLFVVATQTIEVGANVDFDGLVTESAALPAVVQRLGRLNRLGAAPAEAPCVVVHDGSVADDDPVYGRSRLATWRWLADRVPAVVHAGKGQRLADLGAGMDASPAAWSTALRGLDTTEMAGVPPYVPVLFERTLDTWVRTAPAPMPDTPVSPFLHGIGKAAAEVSLVWRAELPALGDGRDEKAVTAWRDALDAVPPTAEETLDVTLAAARRWLAEPEAPPHPISDLGADRLAEADIADSTGRVVLRYRGVDDVRVVTPSALAPGDLVVLRSEDGGCDEFGWHPGSRERVVDVADLALRRGKPLVRLRPYLATVVQPVYGEDVADVVGELVAAAEALREADESGDRSHWNDANGRIRDVLRSVPQAGSTLARVLKHLAEGATARLTVGETDYREVLLATARTPRGEDSTELGSSLGGAGGATPLAAHQRAVGRRAREFATNLGLADEVVRSVVAAAEWHDEGKRDPRFQAMLHGGDAWAAEVAAEPLAKSGMSGLDRRAFRLARVRAGYPAGMRHEALSARAAALYLAERTDLDVELVRHLVAAHHGWSRPLLPPVVDDDPRKVDFPTAGGKATLLTDECVDWEQPARFAALNARYGRWGLALLETVVRLADIWCSELGEQDD